MQSGPWNVSVINSAGWVVNVANTGGVVVVSNTQTAINIINSAGWIMAQSNTVNNVNVINSAGWVMAQSNTSPLVQVQNSAGWIFAQSNTSALVSVQNSAGWIVNVANTGGIVAVSNTGSKTAVISITTVVSTVGLVTLLTNNASRLTGSFYNDSTVPLFIKLGASANTGSYTLKMTSSSYFELPQPVYTGIITGIWQSANGYVAISEGS